MTESQTKQGKQLKQFKILYDWLKIARNPSSKLADDIRLIMDLIQIPISNNQLNFLLKIIDPNGTKKYLEQEDFIKCFIIQEDKKKQKQKQIQNAFKSVASGDQLISFQKLKICLRQQGLDQLSCQLVLKQLGDYQSDNKFDYKKFASWHIQK